MYVSSYPLLIGQETTQNLLDDEQSNIPPQHFQLKPFPGEQCAHGSMCYRQQ